MPCEFRWCCAGILRMVESPLWLLLSTALSTAVTSSLPLLPCLGMWLLCARVRRPHQQPLFPCAPVPLPTHSVLAHHASTSLSLMTPTVLIPKTHELVCMVCVCVCVLWSPLAPPSFRVASLQSPPLLCWRCKKLVSVYSMRFSFLYRMLL